MPHSPRTNWRSGVAFAGAGGEDAPEGLDAAKLEHGVSDRLVGGGVGVGFVALHLPGLEAQGVEGDGHAALCRRGPEGVPVPVVDGFHRVGRGEVHALQPQLGRSADLLGREKRVMVGDAGKRGPPAGLGLAEVGRPLVVDLVDVVGELLVLEEEADAQDAVDHLGVNAVDSHVPEAQLRCRGMGAVLVEAGVEHGVEVEGAAALGAVEEEAQPAEHAELLVLSAPLGAFVGLDDARDGVGKVRGGTLDPEVAGHPGHVDVRVAGDHAVVHVLPLHPDLRASVLLGSASLQPRGRVRAEVGLARRCHSAHPFDGLRVSGGAGRRGCCLRRNDGGGLSRRWR